jgi:hypothetical protein
MCGSSATMWQNLPDAARGSWLPISNKRAHTPDPDCVINVHPGVALTDRQWPRHGCVRMC